MLLRVNGKVKSDFPLPLGGRRSYDVSSVGFCGGVPAWLDCERKAFWAIALIHSPVPFLYNLIECSEQEPTPTRCLQFQCTLMSGFSISGSKVCRYKRPCYALGMSNGTYPTQYSADFQSNDNESDGDESEINFCSYALISTNALDGWIDEWIDRWMVLDLLIKNYGEAGKIFGSAHVRYMKRLTGGRLYRIQTHGIQCQDSSTALSNKIITMVEGIGIALNTDSILASHFG
jgi:hypothetical protein